MNAQEIFDTVIRALRAQGEPSYDDSECLYRSGVNLKCAMGHLIPDDMYSNDLEGHTVYCEPLQPIIKRLGLEGHKKLLASLQQAHDDAACALESPDEWLADFLTRVCSVAAEFELDPKEAL